MVLPIWDPERLRPRLPFNVALCGGRKQGKSCGVAHLLDLLKDEFQLVWWDPACNPVLEHLLKENWDPRFFFSEWDDELIGRLLKQQEELLGSGQQREVLIILDDVILSSKADDQLAHMAMRGRHFRISLMMCAVSYTTLPKRTRRSLDVLLVYSLPMQGDFKVLTYEYCQGSSSMARFALNQLREHECLVLETRNSRCSSGRRFSTNSGKQKLNRTRTNRKHRTKPTLSWNVHRIFIKKELLP